MNFAALVCRGTRWEHRTNTDARVGQPVGATASCPRHPATESTAEPATTATGPAAESTAESTAESAGDRLRWNSDGALLIELG